MKLYQLLMSQHIGTTLLYLIIMLASIDYAGILDYAIKAVIGSAAWFGARLLGDYYSAKIKQQTGQEKQEPK